MIKKSLENLAKTAPALIKNATDYFKSNFEKNSQKLVENASGTAGVLISVFAQPMIDSYFEKLTRKKLENFGFNVYLKSSLLQANRSIEAIKNNLDDTLSLETIFHFLNKSISEEIESFDTDDLLLIYQPKYHPAPVFVKRSYQKLLKRINANPIDIKTFLKNFNDNIEATVEHEFGSDYEAHLKNTEKFRLKDNETKFLWDSIEQSKIGFKETENLKYETTYGLWKKVINLREKDKEEVEQDELEKLESSLKPVNKLIEEYFSQNSDNHLESILFIIADFGKGKSVFMKHYAAELAKKYLQTSEGYFPIYFNLRDFKNYSSEPRLGVISDFLETRYSIKIDDEYFQKKKYIFLVDSLDESGELNKRTIDKVISSVKNIQGINKSKYKNNRIIITSRPFDEGLSAHLSEHNPYTIKNKEQRDVPYFISVYGFTKKQFNTWLLSSLQNFNSIDKLNSAGFAKEIVESIAKKQKINLYQQLLENKTLSESELRRPIFAYMIYQLIINNVDFLAIGKLGVYLSFLNLLTKEAKHIHDINYKVNLKEEFEFRNVLQATSSLWMYERQRGKQGMLKKADICRVLEGKSSEETDSEILERLKGEGLTEIQFLSHSYFGENDNILHFQHQSFAEILLAEYYLKVFIKFALDEDADFEEARVKLIIGDPTEQTILFFEEMLRLLRETAIDSKTSEIIEKRKLLFPLMASLATNKHNRLFCNDIYYSWFKTFDLDDNQTEYPASSLEKWSIDQKKLKKIVSLAANIINSKNNYLPVKAESKTALFNSEVLQFKNQDLSRLTPSIDKWLALLVGNVLYNLTNPNNRLLFNWDYKINSFHLFEMLKGWNYASNDSSPSWGQDLFTGIDMRENEEITALEFYNLDGINFEYSFLKLVTCWNTNLSRCNLDNCYFHGVKFITSIFYNTSIKNIQGIDDDFYMGNCEIGAFNIKLLDLFGTRNFASYSPRRLDYQNNPNKQFVSKSDVSEEFDIFKTMSGFIVYGLERKYFTKSKIKSWFIFEDNETQKIFNKKLSQLNR